MALALAMFAWAACTPEDQPEGDGNGNNNENSGMKIENLAFGAETLTPPAALTRLSYNFDHCGTKKHLG